MNTLNIVVEITLAVLLVLAVLAVRHYQIRGLRFEADEKHARDIGDKWNAAWTHCSERLTAERAERAKEVEKLERELDGLTRDRVLESQEASRLACELSTLRAARNVCWTRPAKRVPANEVRRAFAVAPDAPLWVALNQELDDWLQGLFDEVSKTPSPTLTEEVRLHLAGGIEELREFQKRLLELHASAQRVDPDIEEEVGNKIAEERAPRPEYPAH